jgi:hypothetical protein
MLLSSNTDFLEGGREDRKFKGWKEKGKEGQELIMKLIFSFPKCRRQRKKHTSV